MKLNKVLTGLLFSVAASMANAGKIAVFDHQAAISETELAKKEIKALQDNSNFVSIIETIKGYEADLKAMAEEAESKGVTWSQAQVAEHRKKMEFIQADRQLAIKKLQSEQGGVEQRLLQDMLPKLQTVLQKIAKDMDIDVILKPQSVYYVKPDLDITAEVTKRLNKAK